MLNVFLLTLQYEPKVFVSTRATFFTIVNTAKIALRVYDGEYSSAHASFTPFDERLSSRLAGSLDMGLLVLGLKLGIFSLLGVFVSTHVVKRLSKSLFMKMEYCLMTHAGGKLLYALHLFSPRLPKTPPHLHRDLPGTQVLRAARVILRSTAAGNVALARGCSSTANVLIDGERRGALRVLSTTAVWADGGRNSDGIALVWSCADGRMSPEESQPHQKARGSLALHYACGLRPFRGWCLATEHCQAVPVGIARPTRSVEAVRFGLSRQSDTQRRIAATPSRRGPCPHSRHGVSQCKRNSHEWHYKALGASTRDLQYPRAFWWIAWFLVVTL
jgi:hypothetical protein